MISFNELSSLQNLYQKQSDFTVQEIKFWNICYRKGFQFVLDNSEKTKREFIMWQSKDMPKYRLLKSYKKMVKEFSHIDDLTWLGMDLFLGYIKREVDFSNQSIDPKIEKMIADEFPV